MKVSVILPAYNAADHITQAVRSILAQTMADFECIILDDGSQDATVALVQKFTDPRIRLVINEENMGISRTLNRGIALAQGTYIARMDADDIAFPERLQRQVAFLDAHPDVGIIGTAVYNMDINGRLLEPRLQPCTDQAIRFQHLLMPAMYHPSCMMRRDVIQTHGITYDPSLNIAEDMDFWNQLGQHTHLANLSTPCLLYRKHPQSLSRSCNEQEVTSKQAVAARYLPAIGMQEGEIQHVQKAIRLLLTKETSTDADLQQLWQGLTLLLDCYTKHLGFKVPPRELKSMVAKWQLKAMAQQVGIATRYTRILRWAVTHPDYIFPLVQWLMKQKLWKLRHRAGRKLSHRLAYG